MSIGIVSGWGLVALGVSYYFRTRIGVARWKRLHRWTALAWVLGIAHSLGEGTDAGTTWFLALTAIAVVPALVLLVVRHLPSRPPPPPPAHEPDHAGPPSAGTPDPQHRHRRRGHRLHRPVRDHLHPDGVGKDPALGSSTTHRAGEPDEHVVLDDTSSSSSSSDNSSSGTMTTAQS